MNFGVKVAKLLTIISPTLRSTIERIRESIWERPRETSFEATRISGLNPSAQAWVLAHEAKQNAPTSPRLIICPDEDSLARVAEDLRAISSTFEEDSRFPRIEIFSTWEQSPYGPVSPSIRVRLSRMAVLNRLNGSPQDEGTIILATPESALQTTIPPDVLKESRIRIETGQAVGSRETLIRRLVASGYHRTDPVEDPGTFAARGEIIDVFPPECDSPYRIELFDDVVERIRKYDPQTQRTVLSAGEEREFEFGPAREVLMTGEAEERLREQLKTTADDRGISRQVRDPVMQSLIDGILPEYADAWAPFAYAKRATLLDHLNARGGLLTLIDAPLCQDKLQEFLKEQHVAYLTSTAILPEPSSLFGKESDAKEMLESRADLFLDSLQIHERDARGIRLSVQIDRNTDLLPKESKSLEKLDQLLRQWLVEKFRVLLFASTQSQLERIRHLLQERGIHGIELIPEALSEGFRWVSEGLIALTEEEVLGQKHVKKTSKRPKSTKGAAEDWRGIQALADLAPDDLIVHIDHGVGIYRGLVRLKLEGAATDFIQIEYAGNDKLYLPVYRLNAVQKYVGTSESAHAPLDRLGSQHFQKAKERVRKEIRKLAIDLVELYAQRSLQKGVRFGPPDEYFEEFESKFPFEETPDQLKAIAQSLEDLQSGKVMDRLVCGDVGFGKTEVAMRAAFKVVSDGKQVAVLVPTTVLAHQHEQSFKSRFRDYPVRIESVSRFKSTKEQKQIVEDARNGKIDILIGTHRLLSKDVQFRDLALLIVDEEHRFGVEHKEKIKSFRTNTHVMTLTATPIPRTLHMALSGLREISLINTAPVDRLPIRTFVSRFDEQLITEAIENELARGGQVFFVHNRVQTIHEIAENIQKLVPSAKIGIAHGQMSERELERQMVAFYEKRINLLVCTSIIESGLDVPSANTLIVNRADAFGLAQLYQIRGRVGRGERRAYAYLLIPAVGQISEDARRRLEVIQRFVELGAGFSIASHDLEIRGGGDLLGPQQSGHIAAVGFDLYTELLEEAIREIQGRPAASIAEDTHRDPEIKAPFPAFLAEEYVPDAHQRLAFYRRLSSAAGETELTELEQELRDRFGDLPSEAMNLVWMIRLKQLLKRMGVETLVVGPEKVTWLAGKQSPLSPEKAVALMAAEPSRYQITPDSRFVAKIPTQSLQALYFALESLFSTMRAA